MIHLSWSQYFMVTIPLLILSLLYVLLRYYRKEITNLFTSSKAYSPDNQPEETFGPFEQMDLPEVKDIHYSEAYENTRQLIGKLEEVIAHAAQQKYDHQQLLDALQTMINAYPVTTDPQTRHGIVEFILQECKNTGAVIPEQGEVRALMETSAG